MSEITVSEDTKKVLMLLEEFSKLSQHYFKRAFFLKDVEDEITREHAKIIQDDIDMIIDGYTEAAGAIHSYLVDLENRYGGGWLDVGVSRTLRLLSERDHSIRNLGDFVEGYQKIAHKLVLLDSHKNGQEAIEKAQQIHGKFSKSKRGRAA